jgi:hypothetical protein
VAESDAAAAEQLERLSALIPPDGRLSVAGGAPDESLHVLDLSPLPGTPLRAHLARERVDRDLDRLEDERTDDGGWVPDFGSFSPAAAEEWKGMRTVAAVQVLRANGRVSP